MNVINPNSTGPKIDSSKVLSVDPRIAAETETLNESATASQSTSGKKKDPEDAGAVAQCAK